MGEKTVFVVGGGGYIGGHTVLALSAAGYSPIIVDNFSTGSPDIAERLGAPIERGDIRDRQFLDRVFQAHTPSAVMHFAAFAYVGESVTDPGKYYLNNVAATIELLQAMRAFGVRRFIFSSTCATFGTPATIPIHEGVGQSPINPYGRSKLMIEHVLRDFVAAYDFEAVIFRYFNAAGADPELRIGERHNPESHLIPLAIFAAQGRGELKVFGVDYETPDGTCIRDYVHVTDLADAHVRGLATLDKKKGLSAYNIGNGQGYSVLEVINAVSAVSGKPVPYSAAPRREGDPPRLIASSEAIRRDLGWTPKFPELRSIVETAWRWHEKDRA